MNEQIIPISDKITDVIRNHGFTFTTWFEHDMWIATITYNKYKELSFFVPFDETNPDYSLVTNIIDSINQINFDEIMYNIATQIDMEDFSVIKIEKIQKYLIIAATDLKDSFYKIKHEMDIMLKKKEISYDIYFNIYINDRCCKFLDLKKSEQEIIKKDIYECLEGNKYNCRGEFVREEDN